MKFDSESIHEVILGSFDGLVSSLGVMIGAYLVAPRHVFLIVCCGALAATLSMGAGEYAADDGVSHKAAKVVGMGLSTLVGSSVVALPFILAAGHTALAIAAILAVIAGAFISEVRQRNSTFTRVKCYVQTYGLLFVATGVSVAVAIGLGA